MNNKIYKIKTVDTTNKDVLLDGNKLAIVGPLSTFFQVTGIKGEDYFRLTDDGKLVSTIQA